MSPESNSHVRHLLSDELIELLYREPLRPEQDHLDGCPQCRAELDAFRATGELLSAWNPPVPGAIYGKLVWDAISPRLPARGPWAVIVSWFRDPWRSLFRWRTVAAIGAAVAAMLLITVAIGFTFRHRGSQPAAVNTEPGQSAGETDPLLKAAVREYVGRTADLLSQIENAKPQLAASRIRNSIENGDLDDLIAESRLYRQTAEQEQDREIADLLSEAEALLVDLQHASSGTAPATVRDIQQRIVRSDLESKLKTAGQFGTSGGKTRGTLL
jgi:anti-sigma-K factor RskA